MEKELRKILEALVRYECKDLDDDLKKHIQKSRNMYFTEETLEDLADTIRIKMADDIYTAEADLDYIDEHKEDAVTLDKRKKVMYFNDQPLPAYWYKPGMRKKEVEYNIDFYRDTWLMMGAGDVTYPLLESWHPLDEWKKDFPEEYFSQMERDLECGDTADAQTLVSMRVCGFSVFQVKEDYPAKIRKILEITNRHKKGDVVYADLTLDLYNGSTRKVRCHKNRSGSSFGIESIDGKGFPMMTRKDDDLIAKALFEDEEDIK